jgi:gamma-tubulin complex component 3
MARLIHLMETKFKLFEHLAALKKFLLLGAGDFVAILMESLSNNLDLPANTQYRHTLTAQLEHAVRNSNAQYLSPDVLRRLDSRMLEVSNSDIGWDVFTLEYKISPPVDVIVTPWGSKQYLKVFNLLWRVKRVEFALGAAWRRCMTGARSVLAAVDDRFGRDWKAARCAMAEMVHFINQLQYYILFEVIESSWNELHAAMRKPGSTLDDLVAAHAAYLTAITRKGLLGSSAADFTAQLHELLKVMLAYKDVVDQLYSASVAEFTRRQDQSARIETRTAAGTWGLSEREGDASEGGAARAPAGMAQALSEDDILATQRGRLRVLADGFRRKVTILLGDLMAQPDADMRWLAMAMNFNNIYQPARRKKRAPPGPGGSAGGPGTVKGTGKEEREKPRGEGAGGGAEKGRDKARGAEKRKA